MFELMVQVKTVFVILSKRVIMLGLQLQCN